MPLNPEDFFFYLQIFIYNDVYSALTIQTMCRDRQQLGLLNQVRVLVSFFHSSLQTQSPMKSVLSHSLGILICVQF